MKPQHEPRHGSQSKARAALVEYEPRGSTTVEPTLDLAKKTFSEMARQGMTHVVPYALLETSPEGP